MESREYLFQAHIPTLDDFVNDDKYRKYKNYVQDKDVGFKLFEAITTPENVFKMQTFSQVQLPAITGVAGICYDILASELKELEKRENAKALNYAKQFIGAVVCHLMERNGFIKTSNRKSIPYRKQPGKKKNDPICFVKGTLYDKR